MSGDLGGNATESDQPEIDPSAAHSARIYDYILGGKDNFEADRRAAEAAIKLNPFLAAGMRANRAVMRRMTTYLARETGVRQFLDIGSGLPTSPNMQELAQRIAPESRVVHVDNDHCKQVGLCTRPDRSDYLGCDGSTPGI
jgi:hypothetical protein